jgi:hypothetical protein
VPVFRGDIILCFSKNMHDKCSHCFSWHSYVFIDMGSGCYILIKNVVVLTESVIAFIVYTSFTGLYKTPQKILVV